MLWDVKMFLQGGGTWLKKKKSSSLEVKQKTKIQLFVGVGFKIKTLLQPSSKEGKIIFKKDYY